MNDHNLMLLEEYDENLESFKILYDVLMNFLKKILIDDNHIFLEGLEGRIKTRNSLEKKLELKGMKYSSINDITDIIGARIITFYNDEVDLISSLIIKNFNIDYENSIDKRKLYEVDRFGYMSLHYICTLKKETYYDENRPELNEIKFEIQMRTALQHVWATIFHDTGYKTDIEVPKEYIRNLSRLSGLLELADDEFKMIRDSISNYRKKIRTLVSSGNFKDITLNMDSFKGYLELNPYKNLIDRIAKICNSEVEESSFIPYYNVLVSLGFSYLNEVENMRLELSDNAYKLSLTQLNGKDLDILSNTIALQNLCVIYIVKNGGGVPDIINMYNILYGKKSYNEKLANNIYEQAKAII